MAFEQTRWSLIARAGQEAPTALSQLIGIYWYPLYAFARRGGRDLHASQDVVQSFFAALIEKRFLESADPERGRFRTFLLTAFKRHASKERAKERALKRGGDRVKLSLDFEAGEARYRLEPFDEMTPERLYERRWALALLDKVLGDLEREYGARDESEAFTELRAFLVPGVDAAAKAAAAERLGTTPEAFRVALHRLRKRYRQRIESEILETVSGPHEVAAEIQHLMTALG